MNWSSLFEHRYAIHQRWPRIWDLPLARKRQSLIQTQLKQYQRVLDVGADRREWESRFQQWNPGVEYRSMDINPEMSHDWYDLEKVEGRFGGILMLEVIEHVDREAGVTMLKRLFDLLEPGGTLMMSTPNIWHPPQYLRDVTHVQPWAYDELGGALTATGFEVTGMWRLWNGSAGQRLVKACLTGWLHRHLDLDYAKTLMVAARRP